MRSRLRFEIEPHTDSSARNGKHPSNGRFLPGNQAAKGRGRKLREWREAVREAVSPETLKRIFRAAAARAERGDIAAARFVAEYVLGKPTVRVDLFKTEAEASGAAEEWDYGLGWHPDYRKYE
jgi:hypothetical protein